MKLKLPKIKLSKFNFSSRYIYLFLIVVAIGLMSYVGWFIYQNFYRTITQAEEIIVLKQEVAPDTININRVNAVLEKLNKKINQPTIDWLNVDNPFIPYTPPPVLQPPPAAAQSE